MGPSLKGSKAFGHSPRGYHQEEEDKIQELNPDLSPLHSKEESWVLLQTRVLSVILENVCCREYKGEREREKERKNKLGQKSSGYEDDGGAQEGEGERRG